MGFVLILFLRGGVFYSGLTIACGCVFTVAAGVMERVHQKDELEIAQQVVNIDKKQCKRVHKYRNQF